MRHIKRTFNLILTLAAMLTMGQTAGAATETKTVTFYLDGGASGKTSLQDEWTLVSGGKELHYSNTNTTVDKILLTERTSITSFKGNFIQDNGELEFSNLEGTVTKVELCQFQFFYSGNQMYVGLDKSNS
ncbi:MAG: hypothetical protein K6A96_05910, partial [Prevotella sp.]|nr:hypothetical protein [Prevotella sp.]